MAGSARKDAAEIDINLLPGEEPQGGYATAVAWVLNVGRVLVIIAEVIAIGIFVLNIVLSTEKQALKSQIEGLITSVESSSKFEREFRTTQQRLNEVKRLRNNHFLTNEVLSEFLGIFPQGMVLDSLEIKDDVISFSGEFPSPAELQTLVASFTGDTATKLVGLDIIELNSPSEKNPSYTFRAEATIVRSTFLESKEVPSATTVP